MKTFLKQYFLAILFLSIGIFTKSYAYSFHSQTEHSAAVLFHLAPQADHDAKIFAEAIDIEIQEEEVNRDNEQAPSNFSEFIFDKTHVLFAMSKAQGVECVRVKRLPLRVPSAVLAKLQVFII